MDGNMLLWQMFYFISMFMGTFISYLFPVMFIRKKMQNQHNHRPLSQSSSSKKLSHDTSSSTMMILSHCNCIAAGIFIGICFLNLMPYVDQEFNGLLSDAHWDIDYPIGPTSVILGLFLVLTLETIVMRLRSKSLSPPILHLEDDDNHDDGDSEEHFTVADNEQIQELLEESSSGSSDRQHHNHNHNNINHQHQHHHHGHSHDIPLPSSGASLSFFILMFATSVHSVFEGMALGLQREVTKATHLFIGIILHECLVSFALGLNSARIESDLKTNIKFAAAFSATIPVGIVFGVALGTAPGLFGRIVSAVFQGLAAGTFLHVTFHELIPAEFLTHDDGYDRKLMKIFLFFIGFSVMALLTAVTGAH